MKQKYLFKTENGDIVININRPGKNETRIDKSTVNFEPSVKKHIQDFCFEHDIAVSKFLYDAACFYHDFYSIKDKLIKYREAVSSMLDKLP